MPKKRDSSLAEYRRKRDFKKSPEPPAKKAPTRRKQLIYCVQKHDASRLHYDFRLEHKGALLSWAVPKGPSLNPKDKRLAMRVEDHPLPYAKFEGVIPSGYGAGTVLLWDKGTWTPLVDVEKGLKDGELKFELHGVKLKGSWVLVRTKSRDGRDDRAWLLIKHRDDWSGDVEVASAAPDSVKSFRSLEKITADENADKWESHRPSKTRRRKPR